MADYSFTQWEILERWLHTYTKKELVDYMILNLQDDHINELMTQALKNNPLEEQTTNG